MKREVKRKTTRRLSISLPHGMAAWLDQRAKSGEYGNRSAVVRRALELYRKHHA